MIDRLATLQEAVEETGNDGSGTYVTPYGVIEVDRIGFTDDAVEVWIAGSVAHGDPTFRVVNPPLLVPDPDGDIVTPAGPMKHDPIDALMFVIGSLGGAVRDKGRRGR